jgi:hypothetical protein
MEGRRTPSCALADGDPVHLRPTGAYDGYGATPIFTVLKAVGYCPQQPCSPLSPTSGMGLRVRTPRTRVRKDIRRHMRAEQRAVVRAAIVSRRGSAAFVTDV